MSRPVSAAKGSACSRTARSVLTSSTTELAQFMRDVEKTVHVIPDASIAGIRESVVAYRGAR